MLVAAAAAAAALLAGKVQAMIDGTARLQGVGGLVGGCCRMGRK